MSASDILEQFQKARQTPPGEQAEIELVFSGQLTDDEVRKLIWRAVGRSMMAVDNEPAKPLFARLRDRQDELPMVVQLSLDWLKRTHGW